MDGLHAYPGRKYECSNFGVMMSGPSIQPFMHVDRGHHNTYLLLDVCVLIDRLRLATRVSAC